VIFLLASASRPALGPTQPSVQWVPEVLSPEVKRGRGLMLTAHSHLVPRLSMSRSCTSSPPCASMACSRTALLFFFTDSIQMLDLFFVRRVRDGDLSTFYKFCLQFVDSGNAGITKSLVDMGRSDSAGNITFPVCESLSLLNEKPSIRTLRRAHTYKNIGLSRNSRRPQIPQCCCCSRVFSSCDLLLSALCTNTPTPHPVTSTRILHFQHFPNQRCDKNVPEVVHQRASRAAHTYSLLIQPLKPIV
jgi:hypothetical protein